MQKIVVFVDDSKTILMAVQIALEKLVKEGVIKLVVFDNPYKLLKEVENGFVYDLLVTDLYMPQMNGLDMVKELRNNKNLNSKPILALTTENNIQLKEKGRELGLTGWITKPFSDEKLIIGIKRVLKLR